MTRQTKLISQAEYLKLFKCPDCADARIRFLESEYDDPTDATVICCECGEELTEGRQ